MFRPTTPDAYKAISKENLATKYKNIDKHLAGKQYLMGDKFTVADAYLFTVTRWAPRVEFDLAPFPNVKAFMDRMAARPKVQEALKAEGLSPDRITSGRSEQCPERPHVCHPSSDPARVHRQIRQQWGGRSMA